jgi:hypothetical protein
VKIAVSIINKGKTMKNTFINIIWGKENKFNGLFALGIVCLIVLGCTCNKSFGDLGSKNNNTTNPSNTFTPPTNTVTAPAKDPTFTKADASKKQIPSEQEMQEIIKTTVLDFNSAVQSEDFTDFHAKSSKALQRTANPAKMKETFQMFIDGEMDLSAVSGMTATITSPAKLENRSGFSVLSVSGEYPTSGVKTTFDLQYVAEGKDWKLLLIKIYAPIKRK